MTNRPVVITSTKKNVSELAVLLRQRGISSVALPLIETRPLPYNSLILDTLSNLNSTIWLVFTSVNGVEHYMPYANACNLNHVKIKIAAVGNTTAARIKQYGFLVDFIPSKSNGQTLGKEIPVKETENVFLFRAKGARQELVLQLKSRAIPFMDLPVYETVDINYSKEKIVEILSLNPSCFVFTSPSAVKNYKRLLELYNLIPKNVSYASIGSSTTQCLVNCGFKSMITATRATMLSLAGILEKHSKNTIVQ